MYKIFLVLFLRLNASIATDESDETKPENKPQFILPLVLMKTQDNKFVYPTDILLPKTDRFNSLLFGTLFSANKDEKQLFFCGREPPNENTSTSTSERNAQVDDQYCSYELPQPGNGIKTTEGSNFLKCAHEPIPFVQKVLQEDGFGEQKEIYCASVFNKKSRIFAFVYEFETKDNHKRGTFEVYRFCYDEDNEEVIYTEHVIAAPRLLDSNNQFFEQERNKKYEMSAEAYGFFGTKYETIKNAYKELEIKKDNKKRTREVFEFPLSDQKLVPSSDMAFALWQKTTYHFLNVRPMEESKIELWDYINQLIRQDAINTSREYHVYTGAFNINKYKDNKDVIQSPDFWIRIVHYKWENHNESIAIVMNHNSDNKKINEHFNLIYEENLCENAFTDKFPTASESVRCTSSENANIGYFELDPAELKDHKLLNIDTFIKKS